MRFLRAVMLFVAVTGLTAAAQVTDTAGSLRVPDAAQFVGEPQGEPLTGAVLYARTQEVGALLRCPVCQGMAVSDSPAEMAVNMKHQVSELLARGYTEEQILRYFELSYGQFVLLKPKFEGVNRLVWLLPFVALIAGGAVLYSVFRKLTRGAPVPADTSPTMIETLETSETEDPYLARVRELVTGDKPR